MAIALIDGDVIVYQAGFASDTKTYGIKGTNLSFPYKKEVVAYCAEAATYGNEIDPDSITETIEHEPVAHCLNSVKKMLESIVGDVSPEGETPEIYLSGKGNFRESIPSDLVYKGNRDEAHKPHWYKEIKEYLVNIWGAEVCDGQEADDMLGIRQNFHLKEGRESCICTVDKDLNMIEGLHYNWRKSEEGLWYQSLDGGLRFFYEQLLIGDMTDNIKGLHRVGKVKAAKALEDCDNEMELAEETMKMYAKAGREPHEYINNGRLLWIRTKENEMWMPPV